jgi:amino acid adenylation domain-containing protein
MTRNTIDERTMGCTAASDCPPQARPGEARPVGACLHDRVRLRATVSPDALALAAGAREVTYAQLDGRANAIAGELRSHGVRRDAVVGLFAERGVEMVVGALAILKAGGAYLPLDASYPAERLAFIVRNAGCARLIYTPGLADRVPEPMRRVATAVELEGAWSSEPPSNDATPDALAYVIYTSGSTGRPKGVEITHAGLTNLCRWHERVFALRPLDRASQLAAVGFDAAVWEVWPYLAAGASVHVPDDAERSEPSALRAWLVARSITIAFVPTPMAARLIAQPWPSGAALRTLLTGGDVLHAYPSPGLPFRVVNNYGPTECSVVATSGPVDPYDQSEPRPTIGRPIDDTVIHVLDDALNVVPQGAVGEICIAGAGLARGYRGQPDLTATRFVPLPHAPGVRVYRTGDLGRLLPDGRIAFVGRADDQLKVRGFRIEPNEIVTAMNRHPAIAASAVVTTDLGAGDKRLTAYVVLARGAKTSPSALQAALHDTLPDYMVPGVFVRIDALPLGPHGKFDRSRLPDPSPANTLRDAPLEPPRTPIERRIGEFVCMLWRLDAVSVHDNLFLLGGHSLIATQLIGRIQSAFGVELGLRTIFEAPTIAAIAGEVERLLVAKVDAMTEDEARRLLAGERCPGSQPRSARVAP